MDVLHYEFINILKMTFAQKKPTWKSSSTASQGRDSTGNFDRSYGRASSLIRASQLHVVPVSREERKTTTTTINPGSWIPHIWNVNICDLLPQKERKITSVYTEMLACNCWGRSMKTGHVYVKHWFVPHGTSQNLIAIHRINAAT